jgi:hypothetical protein
MVTFSFIFIIQIWMYVCLCGLVVLAFTYKEANQNSYLTWVAEVIGCYVPPSHYRRVDLRDFVRENVSHQQIRLAFSWSFLSLKGALCLRYWTYSPVLFPIFLGLMLINILAIWKVYGKINPLEWLEAKNKYFEPFLATSVADYSESKKASHTKVTCLQDYLLVVNHVNRT